MNKLNLFNLLLDQLENNCLNIPEDFKYIGTGNPNANILIIGKEASISKEQEDQFTQEYKSNFEQWKEIKDFDQSKIREHDWANHIPLYPYKGQLLKINRNGNCGTSRTWLNYQKLYNLIFNKVGNQKIDFHEGIFITEVNSTPSPKTKDADISSIGFRKDILFRSSFFQSFPIIIIAGLGYFEISSTQNEIMDIFKLDSVEKRCALNKENQPYWIHFSANRKRLLINTRQLSMNVSDALLQEIAEVVREFISKTFER